MEMMGARAAAATVTATAGDVSTEEKEMDSLLSEIPHVTSPQRELRAVTAGVGVIGHGNGVHGGAGAGRGYAAQRYGGDDAYFAVTMSRRGDGGHVQGGGGGAFHTLHPIGVGSTPLPASGPFIGGVPSPLAHWAEDLEKEWLVNQLRGLQIVDAPTAHAQAALQHQSAPVKYAALEGVPAAHKACYGYSFGTPGTSVHQEHPFLDQTKAFGGYVAARPQRSVPDIDFDACGGSSRGLDASIGGFVYNRVANGTGIGWGQGLVHPDLAESYVLSGQAGAEHNWEFFSPSPVVFDARGGARPQYGCGVPAADVGFARCGFNLSEAFRSENQNSLILDGMKNKNFLGHGRDWKLQQYVNSREFELRNSKTLRHENMVGVKSYIYFMAKDQNGCRFLQQKFEQGKEDVDVIFEGIIDHIADLMTNSFANYLVQKMLDVCDEGQRLRIISVLTVDPVQMLRISLNTHGTRAVQKLIETVTTRRQIALIISALHPSFMHLVNDLNGNHVIQKCLTNFGAEDNKFIFEAAATHCFEMAIHRHGCCVLQRCISGARGGYQAKLIIEVCAHGFELAQDPFGNYVVQYVLELKIPSANAHLASQFKGSYVYLSKQKVSSNVVEKCLRFFMDDDKAVIVHELIKGSHFEQLLQDPYANYVIYTALLHTKGPLNNDLVEAIRPHEEALRTNPCCKRISRALFRR